MDLTLTPPLTRRGMLRAGLALAASSTLPIWAHAEPRAGEAGREPGGEAGGHPLIAIVFLRGGADGLHLVPPVGDPHYNAARSSLALSETVAFPEGFPGGGDFALHPALAPLLPLALRGELAVVHAVGSPDATRSHFSAQDRMEAGRPGSLRVHDGWLARALGRAPLDIDAPFSRLALSGGLPLSLRGSGAFAIGSQSGFGLPAASPAARRVLAAVYGNGQGEPRDLVGDPARAAGQTALAALTEFETRIGQGSAGSTGSAGSERALRREWSRGARRGLRNSLVDAADELAGMLEAGFNVRAVCLDSSGWDTHSGQGQGQGQAGGAFARRAGDLAAGLVRLADSLRARGPWLVVVMTEFGRTVKPNGSAGSDHGHGSAMLVAGSSVRPGIHCDWPGLTRDRLYEGRDLAVTTDYRDVLAEVLRSHLGRDAPAETFPEHRTRPVGIVG